MKQNLEFWGNGDGISTTILAVASKIRVKYCSEIFQNLVTGIKTELTVCSNYTQVYYKVQFSCGTKFIRNFSIGKHLRHEQKIFPQ